MPSPFKTLVTVATYNEIENLPLLVAAIHEQAPAADILVIDDNSPDGTGRWCDEKNAEDPRVKCLHRAGKLGLGTALIAGMKYAIENDYDYMLKVVVGDTRGFDRVYQHLIRDIELDTVTSYFAMEAIEEERPLPLGR